MDEILRIIQTLGFPMACVVACGWFIFTMTKSEREENNAREERYAAQIADFGTVLTEFSTTLKSIDNRLQNLEKEVGNITK